VGASSEVHRYPAKLVWTGAAQGPTSSYEAYSREYTIELAGKPPLRGTADPAFRGDPRLHNPEEFLVIALSSCHMLSFLALAARRRVLVVGYEDDAIGTMALKDGRVRFTDVLLRPRVTLAPGSDGVVVPAINAKAHELCFIANSVNFPVRHEAATVVAP
jgi:organic hydroperoxide reductase OsmC/OhrA